MRAARKSNGYSHDALSARSMVLISLRRAAASTLSSAIALVGCGTLVVERTERMPACMRSSIKSEENSAWVTMASTEVAPAAMTLRAQAIIVLPEETISSTMSTARPATAFGSSRTILTERSSRRAFRATVWVTPSSASKSCHPRSRFHVWTDHDNAGVNPDARTASAIAGIADKLSASMPGKTS